MRVQISPLLMFFYLLIDSIHGNGRLNIEERSTITIILPRSHKLFENTGSYVDI